MDFPKTIRHIHLIAICGTGMGSLAGLLKEKGYELSGSDQNTYPPMSTELERLGVTLNQGYKAENLKKKPNLVIVGNAVSKDNPEVVEMLKQQIPYLSMPEALSKFFIQGKKSMVVAGTHGKTTTTAILSHLLKELGEDPSFLIGGILQGNQKNYHHGKGPYFVVEGDEYDTAFFDKGPKFLHYLPYFLILTSLEFDHADIYQDLDHLTKSFEALLNELNPLGYLLACNHYERLLPLLQQAKTAVETYGLKDHPDWFAENPHYSSESTNFDIFYKNKKDFSLISPLSGDHNILNVLACFALLRHLGFSANKIQGALDSFRGVKRRQEVLGRINDILVMDDFAHHPTSVRETIDAIKKRYPDYFLWAVFEPRSNTSKRNIFQNEYTEAFCQADSVILADVFMPEKVKNGAILDVGQVAHKINQQGIPAKNLSGVDSIVDYLSKQVRPKSIILIMSNGGFGGIHQKILESLKS